MTMTMMTMMMIVTGFPAADDWRRLASTMMLINTMMVTMMVMTLMTIVAGFPVAAYWRRLSQN